MVIRIFHVRVHCEREQFAKRSRWYYRIGGCKIRWKRDVAIDAGAEWLSGAVRRRRDRQRLSEPDAKHRDHNARNGVQPVVADPVSTANDRLVIAEDAAKNARL